MNVSQPMCKASGRPATYAVGRCSHTRHGTIIAYYCRNSSETAHTPPTESCPTRSSLIQNWVGSAPLSARPERPAKELKLAITKCLRTERPENREISQVSSKLLWIQTQNTCSEQRCWP